MFFSKVFVCLFIIIYSATTEFAPTTTEVPMTWTHDEVIDTTDPVTLPAEIHLDLGDVIRGNVPRSKLRLVKKADDVEHVDVITKHRGKERVWKMRKHQHFNVYSDQITRASFSVSVDDRDETKMMMFGSFVLGKYAFTISPFNHSFSDDGEIISINGSMHVITQEDHLEDAIRFDNLGERSGHYEYEYTEEYTYILTDMEFGINNKMYNKNVGKQGLTVELFVVLDYSIYKKWLDHSRGNADAAISGLRFYFAHIVNGMNDRYQALEHSDFKISIKPAGYYIARTRNDAPFTEETAVKMNSTSIQAYKALDSFYRWILKRIKYHRDDLPKFDASALFTEYTLMASDRGSRSISGLADIGAICKINAVSINKDFGQYGTIDTATHELGHNLGALHDGSNNTCSTNDQYIMASSPFSTHDSLFFNPYKFSSCSMQYFKEHFQQLNRNSKNCLLDGGNEDSDHAKNLKELPGQKFSLDDQCRLLYGKDSFYCGGGGEHGKAICRSMFCWKPSAKTCLTDVRLRAADGTPCNNKSWCMRSKCISDNKAPELDAYCPHGDYRDKIPFWNSGQTDCKTIERHVPHLCYHTYYENLCCETCKKLKKPEVVGCEYGDRNKTACSVIPTNYCYDTNMKHECCATCKLREYKDSESDCKFGDKVSWCSNSAHFKSSGCYREGDKKLCCKTCQDFRTGPPGCEYGDRGEGCKTEHCQSDTHKLFCCHYCSRYQNATYVIQTTSTTLSPLTSHLAKIVHKSYITVDECSKDAASWCSRIKPSECYRSNQTCCLTCQRYYDPSNVGCEYGDMKESCSPEKCSRGKWYLDNCCSSCAAEKSTIKTTTTTTRATTTTTTRPTTSTTRPTTRSTTTTTTTKLTTTLKRHLKCPRGDTARWCTGIKPYECYRSSHICCLTCLDHLDANSSDCPYGDERTDCKLSYCPNYSRHGCCKTCSNYTSTTSTTTTTATTRKTSTIKSNSILEISTADIKNCARDKHAWCKQLSPHDCYPYSADCCLTCGKFFNESNKGCEFGDREAICAPSACKDTSYSRICCKTCGASLSSSSQIKLAVPPIATTRTSPSTTTRTTPSTTTRTTPSTTTRTTPSIPTTTTARTTHHPKCPRGDLASWCSTMNSHDCYSISHICCLTCLKYFDETSRDCRYGDRRNQCDVSKCDRVYSYYCCATCSNKTTTKQSATTTTTTTTTRSTTTKPTTTTTKPTTTTTKPTTTTTKPTTTTTTTTTKPTTTTTTQHRTTSTTTKKPTTTTRRNPELNNPTRNSPTWNNFVLDEEDPKEQCPNGDMASWCPAIRPHDCYKSAKTCCATCQKYYDKTADEDCEYGDKVSWCENHVKKSSDDCKRPTSSVATKCCKSCKEAFQYDPDFQFTFSYVRPTCSNGDEAPSCQNIEQSSCYDNHKRCCRTCAAYYDSTIPECPYGDKVSWCKNHATSVESCNRKDIANRCCRTCFYLTSDGNTTQSVGTCDDVADWCRDLTARQCYQSRAEFTCCATCKRFRKNRNGECRYGDHVSWCEKHFCHSYSEQCCETCVK